MKLIFVLYVLATTTTIICSVQLNVEQRTRLENLAWLYAQFSLTFDPDELPLNDYFRNNREYFNAYKEVEDLYSDHNLKKWFPDVNLKELTTELEERIQYYQSDIVEKDEVPKTFKTFCTIFKFIKENIFKSLFKVLSEQNFKLNFCNYIREDKGQTEKIVEALKNFEINDRFPGSNPKSLETLEKRDYTLQPEYFKNLKGLKEPRPKQWSVHHIIPSDTLIDFYKIYFKLLSNKSKRMQENHKFDWIKIIEINTQKSLLVQANTLWGMNPNGAKLPIFEFRQKDYVRYCYRFPAGLVFYGPDVNIRNDYPSKNKNLYKGQKNDFESRVIHIVGKTYFEKIKQLNDEILAS